MTQEGEFQNIARLAPSVGSAFNLKVGSVERRAPAIRVSMTCDLYATDDGAIAQVEQRPGTRENRQRSHAEKHWQGCERRFAPRVA